MDIDHRLRRNRIFCWAANSRWLGKIKIRSFGVLGFQTLGVSVWCGRLFTDADDQEAMPKVAARPDRREASARVPAQERAVAACDVPYGDSSVFTVALRIFS